MTKKDKLVFATSNKNKIKEINKMLSGNLQYSVKTTGELGITEDIPETGDTFEENAIQKAQYIFYEYGYNCFAEDTGLVVNALNGEPGIYSARYAGIERDSNKNMEKVLLKLKNKTDRSAYFKTVIALIIDGELKTFEGITKGVIVSKKTGNSGFGYDPVFKPEGYDKTFAEIGLNEKNKISHRAKALKKLIAYLEANFTK